MLFEAFHIDSGAVIKTQNVLNISNNNNNNNNNILYVH